MTSNPMGSSGRNYSAPTPDFSRFTGSSYQPPGSNFYPPNPSIPFTNPYPGSSMGAYPNVTFPSGPPPSFQSSFPSSSLPGPVPPPGIPSYSRPSPSFNPNPPQAGPSGFNPPIMPTGSIPAWVATMQPSPLFNPTSSDYRIYSSPSIPSFASQPFSPTVPSFQPMNPFLLSSIGSQAVSSPPSYLGVVPFSPQMPSVGAGLPSTYSSLIGASFLPSRGNSWTPPSSSSRRDSFTSDRAVVQWTPGHLSSYGQTLPSVERDSQFQFTMLRKFEETARFMYQMHSSPEKPFARWDTMAVAPVAFKLDSQTTLFVNSLVLADLFQRASLTQIQDVQTRLIPVNYFDPDGRCKKALYLPIDKSLIQSGNSLSDQDLLLPAPKQIAQASMVAMSIPLVGIYAGAATTVVVATAPVWGPPVLLAAATTAIVWTTVEVYEYFKRHTPDQEAMSEFVKEFGKKGVSNEDADTLLEWAKEYDFPNRDDRGQPHWDAKDGMDHIHLGPKHIPVAK